MASRTPTDRSLTRQPPDAHIVVIVVSSLGAIKSLVRVGHAASAGEMGAADGRPRCDRCGLQIGCVSPLKPGADFRIDPFRRRQPNSASTTCTGAAASTSACPRLIEGLERLLARIFVLPALKALDRRASVYDTLADLEQRVIARRCPFEPPPVRRLTPRAGCSAGS